MFLYILNSRRSHEDPLDNHKKLKIIVSLFLQLEETMKTAETLLGDLAGYKKFYKDGHELLEELRTWRNESFDDWSRDMLDQINDSKNPLRYLHMQID